MSLKSGVVKWNGPVHVIKQVKCPDLGRDCPDLDLPVPLARFWGKYPAFPEKFANLSRFDRNRQDLEIFVHFWKVDLNGRQNTNSCTSMLNYP